MAEDLIDLATDEVIVKEGEIVTEDHIAAIEESGYRPSIHPLGTGM